MLDAEYLKVLVKKTAEFGNGKIHIIVNNAGFVFQSPDIISQTDLFSVQIYMGRRNPQGEPHPIPHGAALHGIKLGNF